ncbi:acyl-CoA dehydrogenase [Macrococcus hajekii]|uniref:Acyl-CoA dehydrogenase n=1 Tax=Macrococcus hajekii TaxID=198482 RepID=A0A4R6BJN1_9STAP|nr:acyl-CoA dehydrogenase family protein [Macrococcus hajekii]TDM01913.1 acyl-CoA dehydrogenase [Macrococcus hajekii]GGB08502.1 butyryl-CoA dehydrogenase [Macrococcus hajekii]
MDRELFIENDIERKWLSLFEDNREWIIESARTADIKGELNHQLIDWLIDKGYNRLTLPEEHGGFGCNVKSAVLIHEALATYDESTALSIGWHLGVVGEVFEFSIWSDEMLAELATDIQAGGITNRVVSEAAMGSPTRGGRAATNAVRHQEGWLLNGVKTYVSMSHRLTHYLVGAYDEETGGLSFFYIPRETTGCEIKETWDVIGMRATASHDLILNDVFVPDRYRVEWSREKQENPWLLLIPAVYLGIAQGAADDATDFALQHSPDSIEGVIADIPHIETKLGQIEFEMMTSRHFLYQAAQLHVEGKSNLLATYGVAKVQVLNKGIAVTDLAMRIIGGQSLNTSGLIERRYRSIRAGLHNPPMEDAVMNQLANKIKKSH